MPGTGHLLAIYWQSRAVTSACSGRAQVPCPHTRASADGDAERMRDSGDGVRKLVDECVDRSTGLKGAKPQPHLESVASHREAPRCLWRIPQT
jgi:hypothetical protein